MLFDTLADEEKYSRFQRMAMAVGACVGTTLLAMPLRGYLDLANIVMLFLLTVLLVAVALGLEAALLSGAMTATLAGLVLGKRAHMTAASFLVMACARHLFLRRGRL